MRPIYSVPALLLTLALPACTIVDETEHCVKLRYGKAVEQKMENGLNGTWLVYSTECFPTTEQTHTLANVEVRTNDPVTMTVEGITVIWEYPEDLYQSVFLEKRSHERAFDEIGKAIEQGIKGGFNRYSFAEVNGSKFSELPETMRQEIQKAVNKRALVKNVLFSGRLTGPPSVEQERVRTMEQQQALQTARAAQATDSINNARMLANENAKARVKEMSAKAYDQNPRLLQLEIERARAEALAKACQGVQTCVIGGSIADTWRSGVR